MFVVPVLAPIIIIFDSGPCSLTLLASQRHDGFQSDGYHSNDSTESVTLRKKYVALSLRMGATQWTPDNHAALFPSALCTPSFNRLIVNIHVS